MEKTIKSLVEKLEQKLTEIETNDERITLQEEISLRFISLNAIANAYKAINEK